MRFVPVSFATEAVELIEQGVPVPRQPLPARRRATAKPRGVDRGRERKAFDTQLADLADTIIAVGQADVFTEKRLGDYAKLSNYARYESGAQERRQ